MKSYYKQSYFLYASHSMNNHIETSHYHSFHLTLYILKKDDFLAFNVVDKIIKDYLKTYEDTYLNEVEPFNTIKPTIENMGDTFYEAIKALINKSGLDLIQLEIYETPVRIYAISDSILIPSEYGGDNKKNWDEILRKKQDMMKQYNRLGESL